ncbi:hypothetical protein [Rugamonas sp. DEMB1]|uniref:hypothetical protein n=1 Tax=Rugamonas sp. DEMB1 TaxID=3039386 RepID=UPI00244A97EB|nr:hypothetical protein [Rugamonas sp. DEMB1]WGG49793.1 hypothetical protein QC826_25320 [Rugamonas sp. DEMB1]
MSLYQRIACLSTESVETLYAPGAQQYIAGISGFTEGLRQISDMLAQWQELPQEQASA